MGKCRPPVSFYSVSGRPVSLISSTSRVYLLKDRDPVGLRAARSAVFPKWTILIARAGFDAISSIPDLTLSLSIYFLAGP
jgi:hypothetical protein